MPIIVLSILICYAWGLEGFFFLEVALDGPKYLRINNEKCFVDEVSDLTDSGHGFWLAKREFGFGNSQELDLTS